MSTIPRIKLNNNFDSGHLWLVSAVHSFSIYSTFALGWKSFWAQEPQMWPVDTVHEKVVGRQKREVKACVKETRHRSAPEDGRVLPGGNTASLITRSDLCSLASDRHSCQRRESFVLFVVFWKLFWKNRGRMLNTMKLLFSPEDKAKLLSVGLPMSWVAPRAALLN